MFYVVSLNILKQCIYILSLNSIRQSFIFLHLLLMNDNMRLVVFDVDVELVEEYAYALFVKGFLSVFKHVEFDHPIVAVVTPEFAR